MASLVEFEVAGVPVPQGSKTAFVVGKRAVVTDQNSKVLKPWRTAVAEAAQRAWGEANEPVLASQEALWVDVVFRFVRPKSVKREFPAVAPDLDKLCRALLDGITASGLFRDDSQVVDLRARKVYASVPGALVRVGLMAEEKERGNP